MSRNCLATWHCFLVSVDHWLAVGFRRSDALAYPRLGGADSSLAHYTAGCARLLERANSSTVGDRFHCGNRAIDSLYPQPFERPKSHDFCARSVSKRFRDPPSPIESLGNPQIAALLYLQRGGF